MSQIKTELRMAFATSGAIALVVYEAGVAHEVERFVRAWRYEGDNPPAEIADYVDVWNKLRVAGVDVEPVVDILTGASAGGLLSILLGHCFTLQVPFKPFRAAWIEKVDLSLMRWKPTQDPVALYSLDSVVEFIRQQMTANVTGALGKDAKTDYELKVRLCVTHAHAQGVVTTDAIDSKINLTTRSGVIGFDEGDFREPKAIENLLTAGQATCAIPLVFKPQYYGEHWFYDGGLWNNQPVDLAVKAIRDKPAFNRTHRLVVFVEPDPLSRLNIQNESMAPPVEDALLSIPFMGTKGSILPAIDDLLDVNRRYGLYRRFVSDLVGEQEPALREYGESLLTRARKELANPTIMDSEPSPLNMARINSTLFGNDARLIASWCEALWRIKDDEQKKNIWWKALGALQKIEDADLERRAIRRFIQNVNRLISGPDRFLAQVLAATNLGLEQLKRLPPGTVEGLTATRQVALPPNKEPLSAEEEDFFSDQVRFLRNLKRVLYKRLQALNKFLPRFTEPRTLGFRGPSDYQLKLAAFLESPLEAEFPAPKDGSRPPGQWLEPNFDDALRFVIQGVSDLEARDNLKLVRISPDDAKNITLITASENTAKRKLAGDGLGHFQGFLERDWRRNDYIWGRLDAAELLLKALQNCVQALERDALDGEKLTTAIRASQASIIDDEWEATMLESGGMLPGTPPTDNSSSGRIFKLSFESVPLKLIKWLINEDRQKLLGLTPVPPSRDSKIKQLAGFGGQNVMQAREPGFTQNARYVVNTLVRVAGVGTPFQTWVNGGFRAAAAIVWWTSKILPIRMRQAGSVWKVIGALGAAVGLGALGNGIVSAIVSGVEIPWFSIGLAAAGFILVIAIGAMSGIAAPAALLASILGTAGVVYFLLQSRTGALPHDWVAWGGWLGYFVALLAAIPYLRLLRRDKLRIPEAVSTRGEKLDRLPSLKAEHHDQGEQRLDQSG